MFKEQKEKNVTIDKLSKKADWTENCELKRGSTICVVESPIHRQVKRKRKLLQSPLKSILKENLLEGIAETRECQRKPNGLGFSPNKKGKTNCSAHFFLVNGPANELRVSLLLSILAHTHTQIHPCIHTCVFACAIGKSFSPPILFASFRCHCCWSLKICVRK